MRRRVGHRVRSSYTACGCVPTCTHVVLLLVHTLTAAALRYTLPSISASPPSRCTPDPGEGVKNWPGSDACPDMDQRMLSCGQEQREQMERSLQTVMVASDISIYLFIFSRRGFDKDSLVNICECESVVKLMKVPNSSMPATHIRAHDQSRSANPVLICVRLHSHVA